MAKQKEISQSNVGNGWNMRNWLLGAQAHVLNWLKAYRRSDVEFFDKPRVSAPQDRQLTDG